MPAGPILRPEHNRDDVEPSISYQLQLFCRKQLELTVGPRIHPPGTDCQFSTRMTVTYFLAFSTMLRFVVEEWWRAHLQCFILPFESGRSFRCGALLIAGTVFLESTVLCFGRRIRGFLVHPLDPANFLICQFLTSPSQPD